MPWAFASFDEAIMHPRLDIVEHTPTGLPRKKGFACCSTDAKYEYPANNIKTLSWDEIPHPVGTIKQCEVKM